MKHKLLLFLLFILPLSALADDNATNVRVQQKDRDIVITYDLKKASRVRLLMSVDGGSYNVLFEAEGAVGKHVRAGKNLVITWNPLKRQEKFIAKNVRFKVDALSAYDAYARWDSPYNSLTQTFILGQYAYAFTPQTSCGFVFGQTYGRAGLGWFVDMRSNWNFKHFLGKQDGDGDKYPVAEVENGGIYSWWRDGEGQEPVYPFYTGKTESTLFVAHAGFALTWTFGYKFNTLGCYFGLGYGMRRFVMETTDGKWVEYAPTTYKGFSGNIGLIGSIYGLTFRAGVNTINFKYMELEGAIGWMF